MKNLKTVLFDVMDVFECEIEEVIEYYYDGLIRCAVVTYKGSPKKWTIPLYALAIKHKPAFNDF